MKAASIAAYKSMIANHIDRQISDSGCVTPMITCITTNRITIIAHSYIKYFAWCDVVSG
jgi:hypothetical protein